MRGSRLFSSLIVAALVATISFFFQPVAGVADDGRIVIEIHNLTFAPEMPAVEVGDVVVWINQDIVPHTVTATDESWDSGLIESGDRWETVVTAGMVEEYYCQFHPSMIAWSDIGTG